MAGIPPLELTARMFAETFHRGRELRETQERAPNLWQSNAIKAMAKRRMYIRWMDWSSDRTLSGARVREAIRPSFVEWVDRRWGHLSFRLTQIMTGHGCFGQFLFRIGREDTPECHHCPAPVDSAQHTLAECEAWAEERRELTGRIGQNLDLPTIVGRMVQEEEAWTAMVRFSESVLLRKEEAERIRRGEVPGIARQRGRRNPAGRQPGRGRASRPPRGR